MTFPLYSSSTQQYSSIVQLRSSSGCGIIGSTATKTRNVAVQVISCESNEPSSKSKKLAVGSPIVVVEAPRMIKTAASVPCLVVNSGIVKPGDVGRIVSRKPMDVWAVRLAIGTYLIDGKYFKPLELED
uniref:Chlororespiratory reduction 42 n=1 Tax=Pelargonium dichondrifolium TaxID=73194 RepID=A0A0F7J2C5_9ROSI|nr:chlororespiratory reduction 42 [Pelargonium dichondrifolium]